MYKIHARNRKYGYEWHEYGLAFYIIGRLQILISESDTFEIISFSRCDRTLFNFIRCLFREDYAVKK